MVERWQHVPGTASIGGRRIRGARALCLGGSPARISKRVQRTRCGLPLGVNLREVKDEKAADLYVYRFSPEIAYELGESEADSKKSLREWLIEIAEAVVLALRRSCTGPPRGCAWRPPSPPPRAGSSACLTSSPSTPGSGYHQQRFLQVVAMRFQELKIP